MDLIAPFCYSRLAKCAVVACANGNTDGDAADRAAELLTQALFDLQSHIDFLLLAEEEAQVR
jgi:hypothetical protein